MKKKRKPKKPHEMDPEEELDQLAVPEIPDLDEPDLTLDPALERPLRDVLQD